MKAHGITGNLGGGGGKTSPGTTSGPSTPKTPKTPSKSKSKSQSNSVRASTNKKRKIAASSDDIDEANDVKREVKNEVEAGEENGSYTMLQTDPHFDAAMAGLVKGCGTILGSDNPHGPEEIFVVAETFRDHSGGPTSVPLAAPVAFVQQMFFPPSHSGGFYGFVDHHHPSHLQQPSPPQIAIAATPVPLLHEHNTDCPPQTTKLPSENSTSRRLTQQRIYWNGESLAETRSKLA